MKRSLEESNGSSDRNLDCRTESIERVLVLQKKHHEDIQIKDELQPLSEDIWVSLVQKKFKPPSVVKIDGKSNPGNKFLPSILRLKS